MRRVLVLGLVLGLMGAGAMIASAGTGPDVVYGTAGDDDLRGGNGPDVVYGLAGNDVIHGNKAPDELYGGPGDDRLNGFGSGNAPDLLDGGAGFDRCTGTRGDTFVGCELVKIRKGLGSR